MVKTTAVEENIEKRKKRNKDSQRDLCENIKHTNICIRGVPEGEETETGSEKILRNNRWKLP